MRLKIDVISRDGSANPYLEAWLRRKGLEAGRIGSRYGPVTARNYSARTFLDGDGTHLLQMDADMVPDEDTEPILRESGDLIYCGAAARNGEGHFGDDDFGMGCARISRALLEMVEPPWFWIPVNADASQHLACECRYFLNKAQAAGIMPRMVGRCGHLVTVIVKPTATGAAAFRWPE